MPQPHSGSIASSRSVLGVTVIGALAILVGMLFLPPVIGWLHAPSAPQAPVIRAGFWVFAGLSSLIGIVLIALRRRISFAELSLFLSACVVSFILAEIILALTGYVPLRRVVWRVPEVVDWWEADDVRGGRFSQSYAHSEWPLNAQGFAGFRDFEPEDMDRPVRVLLLGDSFTFGVQATAYGNSYAGILERRIESEFDGAVWNTAVPGIGQKQQRLMVDRYLPRLQPQLVFLGFCMNDFHDNLFPVGMYIVFEDGNWVLQYEQTDDGAIQVLDPEAAYRRAMHAVQGPLDLPRASRVLSLLSNALHQAYRGTLAEQPWGTAAEDAVIEEPEALTITRTLLQELHADLTAQGIAFRALIIPDPPDVKDPPRPVYQTAVQLFTEIGIPFIEVRDVLELDDFEPPPGKHWADAGHAKVAQTVWPFLLDALQTTEAAQQRPHRGP